MSGNLRRWRWMVALWALIGLACTQTVIGPDDPTLPALVSARTAISPARPSPSPLPSDTGWQAVAPGVEYRWQILEDVATTWSLVRFDPQRVSFRVLYRPDAPLPVSRWFTTAGALMVVNGGYFTEKYQATGLVVSDGAASGRSYIGFGGMFAVAGDQVSIRWLAQQPYQPDEPLDQAVQSFPILLTPGGQPTTSNDRSTARRTAIALDREDRVVVIICPDNAFTLTRLAARLAQSDLDLDLALNLDGGTSTGFWLASGDFSRGEDSFGSVPAVIAAYPR